MKDLIWTHKIGDESSLKELFSRFENTPNIHLLPVIQTEQISPDKDSFHKAIQLVDKASSETILVISSKTSVDIIKSDPNFDFLKNLRVFCVGKNTAKECENIGLKVEKKQFNTTLELSKHLSSLEGINNIVIAGALQRASKLEEISSGNFNFTILGIYQTSLYAPSNMNEDLKNLLKTKSFSICFSSPSAVSSFKDNFGSFGEAQYAIGETTANSLRSIGLNPVVASEPTFENLLKVSSK